MREMWAYDQTGVEPDAKRSRARGAMSDLQYLNGTASTRDSAEYNWGSTQIAAGNIIEMHRQLTQQEKVLITEDYWQ